MSILLFELHGEMAMWRNVYDSMGSYSCLGPAPSHLAGLCGAALGFASPRSHGCRNPDAKKLKTLWQKGFPWPVSDELLQWEKEENFCVCCRWTGKTPRRANWNVNGCKEIGKSENLRIQQQVMMNPGYEVGVKLCSQEALERLAQALKSPAFPLYLGASFCRAFVRNCRMTESLPVSGDWAQREPLSLGETVPFTRHNIHADQDMERVKIDGYWMYPTLEQPGSLQPDPFVRGYAE